MKNVKKFVGIVAATVILTSCSITLPVSVSEAPIGNKTGTSSSVVLFGFWHLNKNFGIAEAAKNGGIKGGVATVDVKYTSYFIFSKKQLIVQGN